VVDNGSTDGSAEIARDHGAQVVCAPQRGYGAACHAGLLAAMASVVAVMDADASPNPSSLIALWRPSSTVRPISSSAAVAQSVPQPSHGRCGSRTGSSLGGWAGVPASGLPTSVRCEPLAASSCWRCRSGTDGLVTRPRPWYAPPMRAGESRRWGWTICSAAARKSPGLPWAPGVPYET
jgi:glycosyltransferase involved in cell wall biosynthesis